MQRTTRDHVIYTLEIISKFFAIIGAVSGAVGIFMLFNFYEAELRELFMSLCKKLIRSNSEQTIGSTDSSTTTNQHENDHIGDGEYCSSIGSVENSPVMAFEDNDSDSDSDKTPARPLNVNRRQESATLNQASQNNVTFNEVPLISSNDCSVAPAQAIQTNKKEKVHKQTVYILSTQPPISSLCDVQLPATQDVGTKINHNKRI